jgi:hypothetical protein
MDISLYSHGLKNYIKVVTLLYSFSNQFTLLLLILDKINNKRCRFLIKVYKKARFLIYFYIEILTWIWINNSFTNK